MLMGFTDLQRRYGMNVNGVLHVGAHLAEEAQEYASLGLNVWWVEANPDVYPKLIRTLKRYRNQHLIPALVTDEDDDTREFNVTNYDGMSSSIFKFGTHEIYAPDTVFVDKKKLTTSTIDTLVAEHAIIANFLNLDVQGAELLALQGAEHYLSEQVNWIYSEVSTGPVYRGGALMHEIDDLLAPTFVRRETDLGMLEGTHGDALYVRV